MAKPQPHPSPASFRLAVASRTLAAVAGGYALSAAASAAASVALPMERAQAVITALLLSFVIYTVAVMWAFSTRSATRAWLGIAVPTLACAAVAMIGAPGA